MLDSIGHTLKALALLWLGSAIKNIILLGSDHTFLLDVVYYLILIWLVFKFEASYKVPKVQATDFSVCIVGAGFSGIGMAVKLKEMGIKFRLIEKSSEFGGTWWDNQYPGCACDVASHLYSYSYELNPDWTEAYSPQPEIFRYLENVAKKYGIEQHAEFNKRVKRTTWNESTNKWTIETDSGETITANVLISGSGGLHVPTIPEFKGQDAFKGDAFHSAQWKLDYDPKGKTVAVIGTGASAVQVVPTIAPKVKHVKVFQRTPGWIPPRDDMTHPAWMKLLFRIFPPVMYLLRCYYFWRAEFRFFAVFREEGILRKGAKKLIEAHMRKQVKDPEVAEKLIPTYEVGCKRITPSNYYLQSFNRENVSLVSEGIDCFTEEGIKTKDGVLHAVDTIIYATGFSLEKSAKAFEVYGRVSSQIQNGLSSVKNGLANGLTDDDHSGVKNGVQNGTHLNGAVQNGKVTLAEEWGDAPNAYKAISAPGYPNYFFLLGPGSGLGHNSIIFMIECQTNYILDIMRKMVESNIKSVDVKKEVNDEYQKWVQVWIKNKAFNSPSCVSWYKNKRGINYTTWPSHLSHYWWVTRKADLANYHCKY